MDYKSKNKDNRSARPRRDDGQRNRSNYGDRPRRDNSPRRENSSPRPAVEVNEDHNNEVCENGAVIGRNAVRELLKSDRTIDKLLVQKGERTGSIVVLVAQAIERGIPVVETDKAKLDAMAGFAPHQGVIALASEKEY